MHIYCAGARPDALSALLDDKLVCPRLSIVLHGSAEMVSGSVQRGGFRYVEPFRVVVPCLTIMLCFIVL